MRDFTNMNKNVTTSPAKMGKKVTWDMGFILKTNPHLACVLI